MDVDTHPKANAGGIALKMAIFRLNIMFKVTTSLNLVSIEKYFLIKSMQFKYDNEVSITWVQKLYSRVHKVIDPGAI